MDLADGSVSTIKSNVNPQKLPPAIKPHAETFPSTTRAAPPRPVVLRSPWNGRAPSSASAPRLIEPGGVTLSGASVAKTGSHPAVAGRAAPALAYFAVIAT